MSSVNKVILVGRLGADPEVRYTPGGLAIANLRIATSEYRKDEKKEETEWHRVVVFGTVAENCGKYLQKGRMVYIEGRIKTKSWEDRDGNKRYMTEILSRDVKFLGGGDNRDGSRQSRQGNQGSRGSQGSRQGSVEDYDAMNPDDIPF